MGLAPVEINMKLIDDKVKLCGVSTTSPKHPIVFDYIPPLGSGGGFVGIEMITMSFAGCVSTAILGLMKRRGKKIDSYEMNIKGVKCEEPLSLQAIDFVASIVADDVSGQDIEEVMEMAEKISPVWIAIRGNVKVTGKLVKR